MANRAAPRDKGLARRAFPTRFLGCAAAVFLALAVWRGEVITLPPFYETAMGLFHEANFLAESSFDYRRLRFEEKVGNDGGPYAYMVSVLPTLVAITMRILPSPAAVAATWHLYAFGCAALIVASLIWILGPRTDWIFASAIALAAITTPLAITQVELMGMDVSMTAFAVLSLLLLLDGRYATAAASATAAFFMKPTGLIATLASVLFLAIALAVDAPLGRSDRRQLRRGLTIYVAAAALQLAVYMLGGIHSRLRRIGFADSMLRSVYYTCPDLALLMIVALAAGIAILAWRARGWLLTGGTGNRSWPVARQDLRDLARDYPDVVFSAIVIAANIAAIFFYTRVYLVRYLFIVVPFLYIVLARLFYRQRSGRPLVAVPALLIIINVYNAGGRLFPTPRPGARRHCSVLERSREYLADHRSSIAAMHKLEESAGTTPIVAGYPYSYYLSMPRLGYVRRPLGGYAIMPISAPNFRLVGQLFQDHPTKLIFVSAENHSHRMGPASPPEPGKDDVILYRDDLPAPLVIFRKDLSAIASTAAELDQWYAGNLWGGGPSDLPPDLFAARARHLIQMGHGELVVAMRRGRAEHAPRDLNNRLDLALALITAGRSEEAAAASCAAIVEAIDQTSTRPLLPYAEAHYLLGVAMLQQRRIDDALVEFAETLRNLPEHSEARFQSGVARLANGEAGSAQRDFEQVLSRKPNHVQARYHLGLALEQLGQPAEAMRQYEQLLQIDPRFCGARTQLAALLVSSDRAAEAVGCLRQGCELRPDWLAGLNALAWLLATHRDGAVRNGPMAVQYAQVLCDRTGYRDGTALETLAAAFAEAGNFPRAVELEQRALRLKQQSGQSLDEPTRRLESYQKGRPLRTESP